MGSEIFRVVSISNLWLLNNSTGHYYSLNVELMYPNGVVNKCLIWDEEAAYLHKIFEYNKVYKIYINDNTAEYPYTVVKILDPLPNVPFLGDNFLTIAEIRQMRDYDIVDCFAVCRLVGDLQITKTVHGKIYWTRELYVADKNKDVIAVNYWFEDAYNFMHKPPFVIKIRRAIILSYRNEHRLNVSGKHLPEICTYDVSDNNDFEWSDSFFLKKLAPGYFKMKGFIHSVNFTGQSYKACINCRKSVVENVLKGYKIEYVCPKCGPQDKFKDQQLLNISVGEPSLDLLCLNDVTKYLIDEFTNGDSQAIKPDPCKLFIFYVKYAGDYQVIEAVPTEE